MHNFTPISALAGGALIGLAAVWLLATNGRIAGASSILHGLFARDGTAWRAAFLLGIVLAGLAWYSAGMPLPRRQGFPLGWVAAAGLLVGFGTRLGGGCTSGHGLLGLSRFSARSLVATLTFMAAGFATVFVTHHLLGGAR